MRAWRSFRFRLTLWNTLAVALVLGIFGLALCATLQARTAAALDQELVAQARHYAAGDYPFVRQLLQQRDTPASLAPSAPRVLLPPVPPNAELPSEADRVARIRRPRFLDRLGHGVGPAVGSRAWDEAAFHRSLAGEAGHATVTLDGERVRVFSLPWRRGGRVLGVIQIARELRESESLVRSQFVTLGLLLPPALAVAALVGLFLTHQALRPIRAIAASAEGITARDLSLRLPVTGEDELAELAGTINRMIARLEAAFEQQRRFTADASHELRTPLTRLKGMTSMVLSTESTPAEFQQVVRVADEAADAMTRLVQDLLLLSRSDAGQLSLRLEPLDLQDLLCGVAGEVPNPAGTAITLDLPAQSGCVQGDGLHLARVFYNLLENALQHTPPSGRVTIRLRVTEGGAEVRISDTGEGIPAEHLPHVFERFYRADAARSRTAGGTGLGLAISRRIVESHGGTIQVRSEPPGGTEATVTLPR